MSLAHLKRPQNPLEIDYYPLIIDYDFELGRPRGGSACVDFFLNGRFDELISDVKPIGMLYVSKKEILSSGFFVIDFKQVQSTPDILLTNIKGMSIEQLYVEDSASYPIVSYLEKLENVQCILVSFVE